MITNTLDSSSLERMPLDRLARLLDVAPTTGWSAADAAAALAQQLHLPLRLDLERLANLESSDLRQAEAQTFFQALTSERPNMRILEAIKTWAKSTRDDATHPLSGGPATVFYFAAIAAAKLRHGVSITTLPTEKLREGFVWSAAQRGAEPLQPLFEAGLKA